MEKNNLKIIANNGRTNSEIKKHQKNLQLEKKLKTDILKDIELLFLYYNIKDIIKHHWHFH